MNFTDVIKKSVLEGFSYSDITTTKIVVTLLISYVLAIYIHMVYKFATKNAFYYKNYGVSMTIMSVVTAGIILAMQSSLVISLGMVGALSIVRFRTAIKDPMDLLFLFWSISVGIVCGAGLFEIAICVCVVATVGILLFQLVPIKKKSCLIVINATDREVLTEVTQIMQKMAVNYCIKAKNVSKSGMELIMEAKLRSSDEEVINALLNVVEIETVHLLENETDVKS